MKKKGRNTVFKCTKCGKFLSYEELDSDNVKFEFTPDTEFSIESSEYYHLNCKNNDRRKNSNDIRIIPPKLEE